MKRKLILGLAMLMTCSIAFTGCGSSAAKTSSTPVAAENEAAENEVIEDAEYVLAEDQTLRVNLGADPLTLDPQLNSAADGNHVINNAYEGLMREIGGEMVPAMAESYTVSEDGLVYTFTLREAKWSDGEAVKASDFEFAWKRGADPATASEYMYIFESANILNAGAIAKGEKTVDELGVKALDDKTLEVTLSSPTDYFIQLCGFGSLMPVRSDMIDETGAWAKNPEKAVSNGPFVLSEYKMGDQMVYVKNENYWDAANVTLDKIVYYMIVDESTAHTKYTAGEMDVNEFIPRDELPKLIAEDPTLYLLPKIGTYYYGFNMNNEVLKDENVRKALNYAIDREQIVSEITKGGEIAAYGYMPEGIKDSEGNEFGQTAGEAFSTKADVEKAKECLAAAGYPNGEGFPEIEILFNTSESHKKVAEAVQEMYKQNLGINVKITNQEWAVYQTTTNTNAFKDLARRGWIGDYNDAQTMLEIFETTNGQNIGRYSNEAFDAEMTASRSTVGAERNAHLYKAYSILMDEMPIIPIYYYTYPIMFQDTVVDWEINSISKMWLGHAKMVVAE